MFINQLCLSSRHPERGLDHHQRKVDNERTFELYQKESYEGNAESQYMLATMFQTGVGCVKSDVKAYEWFEKSAEQGHAKAQFKLGMMCKRGDAHAMDKTKAFEMMERSAAQGNTDAQNMLGLMLRGGVGCAPDTRASTEMLQRSAEKGHAGSRSMLSDVAAPKTFKPLPKDPVISNTTEIYKQHDRRLQKGPATVSMDRILLKNSATIEQIVNAVPHFDIHQFDQILSAGVKLLVKKSSVVEAQGDLELASAYKQVALNVGHHSLTSEAKTELQTSISSSYLLNRFSVNNAVQQRVAEMHEKVEQKEELERQRVELMRRSEELDRREERIRMQEDEKDEDRKEEVSKRMQKAEMCKYDEGEEYKRLVKSEKEWRQKVDNLRCQLEDVHYHSFLENVNRLIPKRRPVKCLIWYADDKEGAKVRTKLNKIKRDLNTAGLEVVIEAHEEFANDDQSKVVICAQPSSSSTTTKGGTHYSLERHTKPPTFIPLILDGEPIKEPNAIVLHLSNERLYHEAMIALSPVRGLLPTLLLSPLLLSPLLLGGEMGDNETYIKILEAYHAKIKPLTEILPGNED